MESTTDYNPKRRATIGAIIGLLVLIVFLVVLYMFGSRGMFYVFTISLIIFVVLLIIGLVFLLVLKLIFKPKEDMLHIIKSRIIASAEARAPKRDIKVYLMGDNERFERKYLGLLSGITRTAVPSELVRYDEKRKGRTIKLGKEKYKVAGQKEFLFLTIKQGFMKPPLVVGLFPEDVTNPSMDEVYIKDTALSLPFGSIYYPSKYSDDIKLIDLRMKELVERYTLESFLREFKVIINDAIQSNPQHQKNLEMKGKLENLARIGED